MVFAWCLFGLGGVIVGCVLMCYRCGWGFVMMEVVQFVWWLALQSDLESILWGR